MTSGSVSIFTLVASSCGSMQVIVPRSTLRQILPGIQSDGMPHSRTPIRSTSLASILTVGSGATSEFTVYLR